MDKFFDVSKVVIIFLTFGYLYQNTFLDFSSGVNFSSGNHSEILQSSTEIFSQIKYSKSHKSPEKCIENHCGDHPIVGKIIPEDSIYNFVSFRKWFIK